MKLENYSIRNIMRVIMGAENVSPLRMQVIHTASSGYRGINISEHKGDSGTFYMDGSDVDKGFLKCGGRYVPESPVLVPIHKDETLSEYTKDGVAVELVESDFFNSDLANAQMNNDEY